MFPYKATSKFELKGIIQITSNLQFISNVNKKNGVRALKYNYVFKNVNTGTQKLVSTRK